MADRHGTLPFVAADQRVVLRQEVEDLRAGRQLAFGDGDAGHERRHALADGLHGMDLRRVRPIEVLFDGDIPVPDDDQRVDSGDAVGREPVDESVEAGGIESDLCRRSSTPRIAWPVGYSIARELLS